MDPEGDHVDEQAGVIKDFDYFLKVLTAIFFWKKFRFAYDKDRFMEVRRKMLADNNMPMYKRIFIQSD